MLAEKVHGKNILVIIKKKKEKGHVKFIHTGLLCHSDHRRLGKLKGPEFIKTQLAQVLLAELWQLSLITLGFNFPISPADGPDIPQKAPSSGDNELHEWWPEREM